MRPLTSLLIVLLLIGALTAGVVARTVDFGERVTVTHWATGHLHRNGLLPDMAKEFNDAGHRAPSGERIQVVVENVPSELIAKYLVPRVQTGTHLDMHEITDGYVNEGIKDPTVVTPSSAHWLVSANYQLGRSVVDIENALPIVRPVIGIVTYEEMARCLGWPERALGYEDPIALREDPRGWAAYPSRIKLTDD